MEAPTKLDRLERVTDLVLVLLDTQQPLTLDAIAHQVPGTPLSTRRGVKPSSETSGCCATKASPSSHSGCRATSSTDIRSTGSRSTCPNWTSSPTSRSLSTSPLPASTSAILVAGMRC